MDGVTLSDARHSLVCFDDCVCTWMSHREMGLRNFNEQLWSIHLVFGFCWYGADFGVKLLLLDLLNLVFSLFKRLMVLGLTGFEEHSCQHLYWWGHQYIGTFLDLICWGGMTFGVDGVLCGGGGGGMPSLLLKPGRLTILSGIKRMTGGWWSWGSGCRIAWWRTSGYWEL